MRGLCVCIALTDSLLKNSVHSKMLRQLFFPAERNWNNVTHSHKHNHFCAENTYFNSFYLFICSPSSLLSTMFLCIYMQRNCVLIKYSFWAARFSHLWWFIFAFCVFRVSVCRPIFQASIHSNIQHCHVLYIKMFSVHRTIYIHIKYTLNARARAHTHTLRSVSAGACTRLSDSDTYNSKQQQQTENVCFLHLPI